MWVIADILFSSFTFKHFFLFSLNWISQLNIPVFEFRFLWSFTTFLNTYFLILIINIHDAEVHRWPTSQVIPLCLHMSSAQAGAGLQSQVMLITFVNITIPCGQQFHTVHQWNFFQKICFTIETQTSAYSILK